MKSKYWIKLWHEILDDPKMGRMTDRLFRRTIQLFLIAGELEMDGYLPPVSDIAWRLRLSEEELETDLADLASMGIVNKNNGNWHITNFEKRQEAVSGAERVKRHRERKQKQQYYGTGNNTVTTCYGDTDTELTETEKNTANADTSIPSNLGEWLKKLKNGSNKQAILLGMTKTLYPDLVEYPSYSYIGKTARDVGGAGRLAALLWECVPRDPKGDILSYIRQFSKGKPELSRDVNEELEKAGYV
ncbi:hypothetical protein KA005_82735, partial [bacterium]|nr:hypothetical protein [bacterium]